MTEVVVELVIPFAAVAFRRKALIGVARTTAASHLDEELDRGGRDLRLMLAVNRDAFGGHRSGVQLDGVGGRPTVLTAS